MLLFIDFCTCSWIIPWLLPFLLGLGLGWLIWGRLRNRIEELERDNANLNAKIVGLESDLGDCNAKNAGIDSEMALLKGRIREYESTGGSGALGFVSGSEGDGDGGEDATSHKDRAVDIDGDGIPDVEGDVVAGGIDVDGDGIADIEGDVIEGGVDIDGDGISDVVEGGVDVDGDGIADVAGDVVEGGVDIDGDGIADIEGDVIKGGVDLDGDGIADIAGDVVEGGLDIDGDGTVDIPGDTAGGGLDIDGDGEDDMTRSGLDVDGDGIAEFGGDVVEGGLDIDGDGVADIEGETLEGGGLDIDGDGEDDMITGGLDVDGDGIADVEGDIVEGGIDTHGDGVVDVKGDVVAGGIDVDGDGIADIPDDSSGSGTQYGIGDVAGAGAGAIGAAGASGSGGSLSGSGGGKNIYAALKSDNLQVIEGIGPKMNEILNDNGVADWRALSEKSPSDIRAILDSVNAKRYRIIDPTTWPQQAKLAADGDWEDLITLQKNLNSGRKAGATGETDSKVEKLLIKMGVLKRWKQDDLTAVEGIGPKISQLLHEAGITTWRALANTEVSRIQSVLDAAGKRFKLADPGSWPKQAEMAADGRWDDLQEYQDFLQGGK